MLVRDRLSRGRRGGDRGRPTFQGKDAGPFVFDLPQPPKEDDKKKDGDAAKDANEISVTLTGKLPKSP